MFDRVWSCFIKFEGHQTSKQELKTFLLFSCLMGDLLFVWTAAYQTCLMRACVPRLLSGLYQLFDPCLIKHVLTVWPLTSTLACLVTKQCLMVFWSPNIYRLSRPLDRSTWSMHMVGGLTVFENRALRWCFKGKPHTPIHFLKAL